MSATLATNAETALLERLAAGARIEMRRAFPQRHTYRICGASGAPDQVDESVVRRMTARRWIQSKPIDSVWDQLDFTITEAGRRELARHAPALPLEGVAPPVPAARRRVPTLILIPPKTKVSTCKRCKKPIFWVERQPRPHPVSVNVAVNEGCLMPSGTTWGQGVSHFEDCPYADEFRGGGR